MTQLPPWFAENALAPKKMVPVGDQTRANEAFRLAAEGAGLLFEGDYKNARQLLDAVTRRVSPPKTTGDLLRDFHLYRQARGREAQIANKLAVLVGNAKLKLQNAPDISQALREAWPEMPSPATVPLREILGAVGAHEWRKNGVDVAALGGRVHPHYGVFAPIRNEYVDLVAAAGLPNAKRAFDIGTGTGVLALVLAKRGVERVVGTDSDPRAVACARENVSRLGFDARVDIQNCDLWPDGEADLIVCNPPWLPGKATSRIESAIYDPDSRFLKRFIAEAPVHLSAHGEVWLVLSNLAELIGLRSADWLEQQWSAAGFTLREKRIATPRHRRAEDREDFLHAVRSKEQTALYRLAPK